DGQLPLGAGLGSFVGKRPADPARPAAAAAIPPAPLHTDGPPFPPLGRGSHPCGRPIRAAAFPSGGQLPPSPSARGLAPRQPVFPRLRGSLAVPAAAGQEAVAAPSGPHAPVHVVPGSEGTGKEGRRGGRHGG